jgi:hypothetical protein
MADVRGAYQVLAEFVIVGWIADRFSDDGTDLFLKRL